MLSSPVTLRTFARDRFALAIVAGSVLVRLLLSALVGPGFDEAYYHLFAEHPAWGYFDHPPFVALVAGLGHWLTGVWSPLTLRLGAVLVFTLALPGFYLLAGRLFGRDAALLALLLPHATPFFLAGAGAFVLPDNALVTCWVWALVVAERIRNSDWGRQTGAFGAKDERDDAPGIHARGMERTLLFLLLGVLTGLALLAKYHAVLLPASLVIASLYDKPLRRWWGDWRLYAALVLAVLVFSPTIWWNAQNDWISFTEQFGKGGDGEFRLRFDLIGQAIGGQLGYLTPWVGIALWIGAFQATRRRRTDSSTAGHAPGIHTGDEVDQGEITPGLKTGGSGVPESPASHLRSHTWLLAFFLTPVVGMTLIGLTRGILPHWTMPGYIAAFVLAAGAFTWTARVRRNTVIALGINLLLVLLVVVQAWTGLIPLSAKSDPTLDPAGWSAALDSLEARGELRNDDVLFVHKWFTGGEIAFADHDDRPVVLLGDKPHMFAWWAPETDYLGRSGVVLTQRRYDIDAAKHLEPRFLSVEPLSLDSVRHRGRWVRMKAWRVTDLNHPRTPPYGPSRDAASMAIHETSFR